MTKQEWLDTVKVDEEVLKGFIRQWHPTNIARKPGMRITAPNVEAASYVVRAAIRNQAERGGR